MASNTQNKKLKIDVDFFSGNTNTSHETESMNSDGSDTSEDYVFIDLAKDGNVKCRDVNFNGCHARPGVSSRTNQRPPVVIDLTGEDSSDNIFAGRQDLAQPSTSTAQPDSSRETDADNSAQLLADVQWVCSEVKKKAPLLEVDPNLVFVMLESCGNKSNRCELVLGDLTMDRCCATPANSATADAATANPQPDLFEDVTTVMKAFPQADANIVYGLLEAQENQDKRVECVMHILKAKFGDKSHIKIPCTETSKSATTTIDSAADDPLYDDVQSLALIFPTKDEELLYARLRAHKNKPDRIQVVSRELMSGLEEEAESPMDTTEEPEEPQPSTSGSSSGLLSGLQRDLELLSGFYPQCDPNHIFSRLEVHQEKENRVEIVSQELENDKNYPKRKDAEAKEKRQRKLKTWVDFEKNLPDLLANFDDINEQFYNFTTKMSLSYKRHLQAQLEFDFPWLKPEFLTSVCEIYEYHLLPSYRYLQELRKSDVAKKHRQKVNRHRDTSPNYPQELDEYFFKELLFVKNEGQLQGKVEKEKAERARRLEEAKSLGLLQECGCCYDDEVLMEDMLGCPEGHLFCKSCIRRSTEVVVGEARAKFPCLTGTCEATFTLPVIQKAVSPKTYALVLRRIQEEELREAGIENLVLCPFCSFATIMENPDDKVFKCLNPECKKESCRLCQEENHVPLRCDEVEKKHEVDMRTYIEQKMTEAMLRTCHNCKKRFYKVEGCNKMTCVCGASMCYVCRQPIQDYSHFNNGRCNDQNAIALHKKEVEEAFKKAQDEYFREHPEAKDVVLKHDPRDHLKGMESGHGEGGAFPGPMPFPNMPNIFFGMPAVEPQMRFFARVPILRRMFWVDDMNEEESDTEDTDPSEESDDD